HQALCGTAPPWLAGVECASGMRRSAAIERVQCCANRAAVVAQSALDDVASVPPQRRGCSQISVCDYTSLRHNSAANYHTVWCEDRAHVVEADRERVSQS